LVHPLLAKDLKKTKQGRQKLKEERRAARSGRHLQTANARRKRKREEAAAARMVELREQHGRAKDLLRDAVSGRMNATSLESDMKSILECANTQLDKDHIAATIKQAVALHDFFRLQ
jgi:translation initiation factor 2 alpha subunit (eIF-2alpha)